MPSKIEYVDETWNPVTGCSKISPGCQNCYAERMARRLAGRFGYPEAPHHFDVTLHPDRLDEPLRRKKPTRYLVCSMGDLFHRDVPDDYIARVCWVMNQVKDRHTFLTLTKRPKRMAAGLMPDGFAWAYTTWAAPYPLRNVWPGVTVETQDQMWRVEELRKIPAARYWVSGEPCLGPLDFGPHLAFLSFIVLGGETGPGARPTHPDWARKVRDDCVAAGVDFFFKGWGQWRPVTRREGPLPIPSPTYPFDKWQDHNYVWVAENPSDRLNCGLLLAMKTVGKKAAGRLLDGREWNEIPE